MARPTLYNDKILNKTKDYIKGYENFGDVIPTVTGLSTHLNIAKRTIYNWSDNPAYKEFMHALDMLKAEQHRQLLNKGLKSEFNSAICKLMLMNNHGYHTEKQMAETKEPEIITVELRTEFSDPLNFDNLTDAQVVELARENNSKRIDELRNEYSQH